MRKARQVSHHSPGTWAVSLAVRKIYSDLVFNPGFGHDQRSAYGTESDLEHGLGFFTWYFGPGIVHDMLKGRESEHAKFMLPVSRGGYQNFIGC